MVDSATLRDAQAHPEQYRDLVVRVSGYSALFTGLSETAQNEIISRMEYDLIERVMADRIDSVAALCALHERDSSSATGGMR